MTAKENCDPTVISVLGAGDKAEGLVSCDHLFGKACRSATFFLIAGTRGQTFFIFLH